YRTSTARDRQDSALAEAPAVTHAVAPPSSPPPVARPAAVVNPVREAGATATAGASAARKSSGDGAAAASPAAAGSLRLELQPTGPCWASAQVDGKRVVYHLMAAGEHASVDAQSEIVLRIGDGAVCAFSINGSRGRELAPSGRATTVHITPGNFRSFLKQ